MSSKCVCYILINLMLYFALEKLIWRKIAIFNSISMGNMLFWGFHCCLPIDADFAVKKRRFQFTFEKLMGLGILRARTFSVYASRGKEQ